MPWSPHNIASADYAVISAINRSQMSRPYNAISSLHNIILTALTHFVHYLSAHLRRSSLYTPLKPRTGNPFLTVALHIGRRCHCAYLRVIVNAISMLRQTPTISLLGCLGILHQRQVYILFYLAMATSFFSCHLSLNYCIWRIQNKRGGLVGRFRPPGVASQQTFGSDPPFEPTRKTAQYRESPGFPAGVQEEVLNWAMREEVSNAVHFRVTAPCSVVLIVSTCGPCFVRRAAGALLE